MVKLLRLKSMSEATGLSRATIYARIQAGLLPKPVKHGERYKRRSKTVPLTGLFEVR